MAGELSIIPSCIRWGGFKEDDLISGTTPLSERYSDVPIYTSRVWAPDTLTFPATYPEQPSSEAWEYAIQNGLMAFGEVPDSFSAGSSYKPRCTTFRTAMIAGKRVESAVVSDGFRNYHDSGDTNHYKNVSLDGVSSDWIESNECLEYQHEYRGTGAIIVKTNSEGLESFGIDYDNDTREQRTVYRIPSTCEEDPLPPTPDPSEWFDWTHQAIPEGSSFTTIMVGADCDTLVANNLTTEWEDNAEGVGFGASLAASRHTIYQASSIWTENVGEKNPTQDYGVKSQGARFYARILVAGLKEGSYSIEYPIFTSPFDPADPNRIPTLSEIDLEWKTTTVSVAKDFQVSFSGELEHNADYSTTTSYGGFSFPGVSGRPDSIKFTYSYGEFDRTVYLPLLRISES